jgi:hypothetical protein
MTRCKQIKEKIYEKCQRNNNLMNRVVIVRWITNKVVKTTPPKKTVPTPETKQIPW